MIIDCEKGLVEGECYLLYITFNVFYPDIYIGTFAGYSDDNLLFTNSIRYSMNSKLKIDVFQHDIVNIENSSYNFSKIEFFKFNSEETFQHIIMELI